MLLRSQEFATRSVAVLTCHHGAGADYRSVWNLGLLIDIWIATSCWPFLFGHVVHLSRCDMLPGLYGQYAPCIAQSVSFPFCLITTHTSTTAAVANKSPDCASSPRYKSTLLLLRYSLKPWAQRPTWLNSIQLKWLRWVELSRVGHCDHALKLLNAIYTAGTYSHYYAKGGLWSDREWKLLCRLRVGKRMRSGTAGDVANLPCIHARSYDAAFRWLSLLYGIMRGSF